MIVEKDKCCTAGTRNGRHYFLEEDQAWKLPFFHPWMMGKKTSKRTRPPRVIEC